MRSRASRLIILEASMGSVTVCALFLAACAVVHAASDADRSGDYSPPSSYADEDEIASAVPRGLYPPITNYSFPGHGTCGPPRKRGEFIDVTCHGPEQRLYPGQVDNAIMVLASPYPKHGLVEVINQTAQIVTGEGNPVPLSEVYMHHFVGATTFLVEAGAELRGRQQRAPLEWPYSWVVNGEDFASDKSRAVNVYLISTAGVGTGIGSKDIDRCLQCPCDDDPDRGGYSCCKDCNTQTPGPPRTYHFQYNVTYRKLGGRDIRNLKPVDLMWYDVTGVEDGIEYQILEPSSEPNATHMKTYETVVDGGCEQEHEFEIVRCTGHQHIGSRCITLYNADNGDRICQSCPVYGTEPGKAGNEKGYVVKMTDEVLSPPYKIAPGTKVRLESAYDGTQRRTGVMGLVNAWVTGLSTPCYREFGYYHYHHFHRHHDHSHAATLGSW